MAGWCALTVYIVRSSLTAAALTPDADRRRARGYGGRCRTARGHRCRRDPRFHGAERPRERHGQNSRGPPHRLVAAHELYGGRQVRAGARRLLRGPHRARSILAAHPQRDRLFLVRAEADLRVQGGLSVSGADFDRAHIGRSQGAHGLPGISSRTAISRSRTTRWPSPPVFGFRTGWSRWR